MNDLAVFDFNGNNVRTLVVDRKPMFVAKDVADVLGYVRPDEAVSAHCRYVDKTSILKHSKTAGSSNYGTLRESGYPHNDIIREWQVIPESDVYRLVMRSQLPAAVEFQDWVCEVVLPSIRQNGGYIANQENDDPALILAKALQVAQRVIDSNQAKLAAANQKLIEAAPKVDFADRIAGADKGTLIGNFAKTVGLGPKKIFSILRKHRILMAGGERHNLPFQEYIDRGYFTVKQSTYETNDEARIGQTTLITGKGELWLTKRFIDLGILKARAA